jgi:hypothetical protein
LHAFRMPAIALGALLASALVFPASATAGSRTRLVDCDAGSCLLVSGRREHVALTVSINGHAVPVEGSRNWRAVLPVETLRDWSVPYARTITVAVADDTQRAPASSEVVDLPIGLLGDVAGLAMLVIRVE